MLTCIRHARVIDPPEDQVRDLWIQGDQLVESPQDGTEADQTIDASGCIAMAGGIDLHTHIGGGKVTLARMLLGDQMPPWRDSFPRDQSDPRESKFLPTADVTASRYLAMGYTACFEPAVIPCNARSAHAEMADVRGIDTGGYCLLGNDDVLLKLMSEGCQQSIINDYVAWMVTATRCLAVKVVNPGGISAFKFNSRMMDVDLPHPTTGVTAGQIIRTLCRAVHEIGLPHPLHVHCSNLGVPGNIRSTLATIAAADGYPIHLTHAQFHSYGDGGPYKMSSAAAELAEAVRRNPNVTIDVGQIQFGRTVTVSADSMHQFANRNFAKPRKSILLDIECEAGCGVVPFRYQRREYVHSLQWAIGLELFLLIDDPSRVFLTTDHPNGAPFTAYPHLIGLLGNRALRETALAEIHPEAAATSSLKGLAREYSLADIATMTRSAPARILGLTDRGRLVAGCVADVVLYREQSSLEKMFAHPELVLKSGTPVGQMRSTSDRVYAAKVSFDRSNIERFRSMHARTGTFALDRLWIEQDELVETIGVELHEVDGRKGMSQ